MKGIPSVVSIPKGKREADDDVEELESKHNKSHKKHKKSK
jgi:hypothetical protein